jgi:hypothetical protein
MSDIILLPGIGGSGESHWQTLWERRDAAMTRFQPGDWDKPERGAWIDALETAVQCAAKPPVLVAHSLACFWLPIGRRCRQRPLPVHFWLRFPIRTRRLFRGKRQALRPRPKAHCGCRR